MAEVNWGDPYDWTSQQWGEAGWANRFILINPYFWRYL